MNYNNKTNYIITGNINSGKTTKLISIFNSLGYGDGFALTKIYDKYNNYIGQKIIRLSTGDSKYFSFKKNNIPNIWDEIYCYKNYSFSKKGLLYANEIILDIIAQNIEPIFIDEIGPLELLGDGFNFIFSQALLTNKEIYFTTRKDCLENVIRYFKIKKHFIITTDYQ